MEFGGWKALRWFDVIPAYNDNRELDETERVSCQIRRMTALELGAQQGWEDGDGLYKWRDQQLKELALDAEDTQALNACPKSVLTQWRQFAENTRQWRNFVVDGKTITDPRLVFVNCYGGSLFAEINAYTVAAAQLTGDALKNFAGRVAGTDQDTVVPPAKTDAAPSAADTQPVESEL